MPYTPTLNAQLGLLSFHLLTCLARWSSTPWEKRRSATCRAWSTASTSSLVAAFWSKRLRGRRPRVGCCYSVCAAGRGETLGQ